MYEADVAVPAVVDVPGDEVALCHVPPDLSGAVSMLWHAVWVGEAAYVRSPQGAHRHM